MTNVLLSDKRERFDHIMRGGIDEEKALGKWKPMQ